MYTDVLLLFSFANKTFINARLTRICFVRCNSESSMRQLPSSFRDLLMFNISSLLLLLLLLLVGCGGRVDSAVPGNNFLLTVFHQLCFLAIANTTYV